MIMINAYAGVKEYAFVSYSHKDSPIVFSSLEYLSGLGYRLWYDEGIDVSTLWADKIAEKIKNCVCFLCFLSLNSMSTDSFVRNEIHLARKYKKKIIIIYIDDVDIDDGISLLIGDVQGMIISKDEKGNICEKDMNKLCKSLPDTIHDNNPPKIDNDEVWDIYYLIHRCNDIAYYVLETTFPKKFGGMYEFNIVKWNFNSKEMEFFKNGHFLIVPEIAFVNTYLHNIYLTGTPETNWNFYKVKKSLNFSLILEADNLYKRANCQLNFIIQNPFEDDVEVALIDMMGDPNNDKFEYFKKSMFNYGSKCFRENLYNETV